MKRFWLVKSEPESYSWDNLKADGLTSWTGVRNFLARKNLRTMSKGDDVLFYHSVTEKAVVGIATVRRTAYPDPTAKEGDWSTVDLAPKKKVPRPVTLTDVRADKALKNIPLLRCARLSVQPLSKDEFDRIVKMGSR
jgi:predicted RNA-binding protein with PUA-like domain